MPIGAFRLNTLSAALAASGSITASGGALNYYTSGGVSYKVHTFTSTGNNNFIVSAVTGSPVVDTLLVGGGAAGGAISTTFQQGGGGGGGGGQVLYQTGISVSAQTYVISVGAGGTASATATSNAGTQTTGLGYTALGGGSAVTGAGGTNGGGSGTVSSSGFTSTAGTYPYKGGNSFGSSTANRAGGGGAGAGGAGGNATSATGGAGGLPLLNSIDGNNTYYAAGGGGSGFTTGGVGWDSTGTSQISGNYGQGKGNANTSGQSAASGTYGSGGGGAISITAGNGVTQNGGAGRQGISIVRYPFTGDWISFVSTANSAKGGTNITIPTVQTGDIAILFQGADNTTTTAPTAVNPSGWTSVVNASQTTTAGLRIQIHYKILNSSDSGTSVSCMSGTANSYHHIVVYRPSRTYTLSTPTPNQQATNAAPTNQTLTMTGITGPYIGVAYSYSSGTPTLSSTTTATRTAGQANNGGIINLFESTDSGISFATPTISATDTGQNALASFRLILT